MNEHGTITSYFTHRCRCDECRRAGSAYQVERRKKIAAGIARRGYGESRHGTPSRYTNRRCRCDECKAAMSAYGKAYYARRKAAAS